MLSGFQNATDILWSDPLDPLSQGTFAPLFMEGKIISASFNRKQRDKASASSFLKRQLQSWPHVHYLSLFNSIRIFIEQLFSFKIYLPETKHITWCMKDFGTKKLQHLLLASPHTSHVTVGKHLALTSLSPTVLTLTVATFQETSFSASHRMLSNVEKHLTAQALGPSKHSR